MTILPPPLPTTHPELRAGRRLDQATFAAIRRRAMLDFCKWDPQVGDVSTLAPFPLILRVDVWRQLAEWAEQLTAETLAAEQELVGLPRLHDPLAVPRPIRKLLRAIPERDPSPAAFRIMRFDFHPTTEGWRLSEVNSDVPGGFTEATSFTQMMAGHFPEYTPPPNPTRAWLEALLGVAGDGCAVGLLSAPGYMEDLQIMVYLRDRLAERGCRAFLANPLQLSWQGGRAFLAGRAHAGRLDVLVRFYQAEWLTRLSRRCGWDHFFCGGRTPLVNPGVAILTESKRFPLVWDALGEPLTTWRLLLPETRDPRDAPWRKDESWLLKSAYCNTGDTVTHRSLTDARETNEVWREVHWRPGHWIAQRKFHAVPIETPSGVAYPCIGIYTVNGQVCGAYARIAPRPLINYSAVDVPLLLDGEDASS